MQEYLRQSCLDMYSTNEHWLGSLTPEVLEDGHVRNACAVPPESGNYFGFAFGGFLMSLVDVTGCCVPWTLGKYVVTQTADVHFIKGVKVGARVFVDASCVHIGRTSCIVDVRIEDESGDVLLTATLTAHIVGDISPDDPRPGDPQGPSVILERFQRERSKAAGK